jgi:hypothetical protein
MAAPSPGREILLQYFFFSIMFFIVTTLGSNRAEDGPLVDNSPGAT